MKYICERYKICGSPNCPHKIPHNSIQIEKFRQKTKPCYLYPGCDAVGGGNKIQCIKWIEPKPKIYAKRYSFKQLHQLWIEWGDKYDISFQKMFREFNLPGSFTSWLEKKERNEKI